MKKVYFSLFTIFTVFCFAQQKGTGVINLTSNMTADITLDNSTSKVTLVLTGPQNVWFALGFGSSVTGGFSMGSGDVVRTDGTNVFDARFSGFTTPPADPSQDWNVISNSVSGSVRTLTLERDLDTGDSNDVALPFATTNSINLAWARGSSTTFSNHGGSNRGFAVGTLTNLATIDAEIPEKVIKIATDQANNELVFETGKFNIESVNVFDNTGKMVKSFTGNQTKDISNLNSGVYFVEMILDDGQTIYKKFIKS